MWSQEKIKLGVFVLYQTLTNDEFVDFQSGEFVDFLASCRDLVQLYITFLRSERSEAVKSTQKTGWSQVGLTMTNTIECANIFIISGADTKKGLNCSEEKKFEI